MAKNRAIKSNDVNQIELALIEGCVKEDRDCQAQLYQKYANKMFAVCLRYCNSREEAEDVLQDSFVKIFDRISTFRKEGSLEGWIRRIMVNTALKSRDKRRKKFEVSNLDNVAEPEFNAHTLANINTKDLMRVINALPEGYQQVFNLYAVEGYSHKEIGELLGVSESTSRSQYSRARKILMERVNQFVQ